LLGTDFGDIGLLGRVAIADKITNFLCKGRARFSRVVRTRFFLTKISLTRIARSGHSLSSVEKTRPVPNQRAKLIGLALRWRYGQLRPQLLGIATLFRAVPLLGRIQAPNASAKWRFVCSGMLNPLPVALKLGADLWRYQTNWKLAADLWRYQTERKLGRFGGRNFGGAGLGKIGLLGRVAIADKRFLLDRHCPLLFCFWIARLPGYIAQRLPNRGTRGSDVACPVLSAAYVCFTYIRSVESEGNFKQGLIINPI
jgi:hypothetical protein